MIRRRMATGEDWKRGEVEAAVAAYRTMLRMELQGFPFNKAESNRAVQALTGRNKGSVEFKHQNISAILNQLGLPYIEGYKPRGNFQALLQDVVVDVIVSDLEVNTLAQKAVERQDFETIVLQDLLGMWVAAPTTDDKIYSNLNDSPALPRPQLGKNYVEIEAKNRNLGAAGEKLVLELEHHRLWQAGQKKLADRVEHVAQSQGDGLGYDVLSFEEDGRERLIEVKTTQFGILTPFFATRNEVSVSEAEAERYQLYRGFSFGKQTRLFTLPGAMKKTCQLTPTVFVGTPR